jgi:hypothetical protein
MTKGEQVLCREKVACCQGPGGEVAVRLWDVVGGGGTAPVARLSEALEERLGEAFFDVRRN